jgi:hypothetical protein
VRCVGRDYGWQWKSIVPEQVYRYSRPVRRLLRRISRRTKPHLLSFEQKINAGEIERPAYAFCLYYGAFLGKRLGYSRVSVLELGVAGGNGLVALENYAREIKSELQIEIELYGFDSGAGLPEPRDFRDIPYVWRRGFYPMDEAKLRARLNESHLIIGNVSETGKTFFGEYDPAPIAAAFFDLDFYSSTMAAMQIFEGDEKHFLPRVYCYFDDTTSDGLGAFNDYTGERLAIREFNESHQFRKFAAIHLYTQSELWQRRLWVFHNFAHSKYNSFVLNQFLSMPLKE